MPVKLAAASANRAADGAATATWPPSRCCDSPASLHRLRQTARPAIRNCSSRSRVVANTGGASANAKQQRQAWGRRTRRRASSDRRWRRIGFRTRWPPDDAHELAASDGLDNRREIQIHVSHRPTSGIRYSVPLPPWQPVQNLGNRCATAAGLPIRPAVPSVERSSCRPAPRESR